MPRLFIAALPPAPVLDEVAALPRPAGAGVRWTIRDHWHVTVRFLGEAAIEDSIAALSVLAAAPLTATLGPKVEMLGRNIVSVPVSGLAELAAAVNEVTAHLGEPPDPRPFHGHITLARLANRASSDLPGTEVTATFEVDEVHLVQSTLGNGGPTYETVFVKRLAG